MRTYVEPEQDGHPHLNALRQSRELKLALAMLTGQ